MGGMEKVIDIATWFDLSDDVGRSRFSEQARGAVDLMHNRFPRGKNYVIFDDRSVTYVIALSSQETGPPSPAGTLVTNSDVWKEEESSRKNTYWVYSYEPARVTMDTLYEMMLERTKHFMEAVEFILMGSRDNEYGCSELFLTMLNETMIDSRENARAWGYAGHIEGFRRAIESGKVYMKIDFMLGRNDEKSGVIEKLHEEAAQENWQRDHPWRTYFDGLLSVLK